MAIIKVTFDEDGQQYWPDPNGKFELDDMASHPHRFQVKDGVLAVSYTHLTLPTILLV